MNTILIVEDEKEINDLIAYYLKNENYQIIQCLDGAKALDIIDSHQDISLAVLDVMLPKVDGFELCRQIRTKHTYPIIMLTAKEEEINKINGLTLGADDYLTKPFKPLELVARIKAQLRRVQQYNQPQISTLLTIRALEMDLASRKVFLNGQELHLTPLEFSILQLLMEKQGTTVYSEEIFKAVWKEKYYTSANNTIMVHIRHLREKMGESASKPKYIQTVWGVGYKIE